MGLSEPTALNPGALTAVELDTNPRMAQPAAVTKNARKEVHQIQTGISATHAHRRRRPVHGADLRRHARPLQSAHLRAWWTSAAIRTAPACARRSPGTIGTMLNRLTAGIDGQYMHDDRQNWNNCNGVADADRGLPDAPGGAGDAHARPDGDRLERRPVRARRALPRARLHPLARRARRLDEVPGAGPVPHRRRQFGEHHDVRREPDARLRRARRAAARRSTRTSPPASRRRPPRSSRTTPTAAPGSIPISSRRSRGTSSSARRGCSHRACSTTSRSSTPRWSRS